MALQAEDADAATRERWRQWRAADPSHEHAWQRMEAFADQLQHMPVSAARAALSAPRSAARRQLVKALAVVLVASGTGWTLCDMGRDGPWWADKRTGAGEQARMTLPDGTLVELNSGTAIAVRFSDSERTLRLLEGEILVTTAHDTAGRPFLVHTLQGRLRALGTRFSVRECNGSETRLAVFEGAVEIQPAQKTVPPQVLRALEQTQFTRDAMAPVVPAGDADIAWTQGLLVAQDMPLPRFLDELGRHRPGHLGYAASVANLRVSGVYPLADTDRVLAALEHTLPIRVRRISRYWASVLPK